MYTLLCPFLGPSVNWSFCWSFNNASSSLILFAFRRFLLPTQIPILIAPSVTATLIFSQKYLFREYLVSKYTLLHCIFFPNIQRADQKLKVVGADKNLLHIAVETTQKDGLLASNDVKATERDHFFGGYNFFQSIF